MRTTILLLLAVGCGDNDAPDSATPPAEADADTDADTDADSDADTDADTDADADMPDDPRPFTITVSGEYTGTLSFDEVSCSNPLGSSNFSIFWRDSSDSHFFVLVGQMLGTLDGTGTYDASAVTVKLQEEAGGNGNYFASSASDTVSFTIDHIDEQNEDVRTAWGSYTVSGLSGAVSFSEAVPIWCPSIN